MGEETGAASARGRPDSSTAKNRDAAKKRAALWKKQIKSFKLKDVGKKVDAVRFCAQDERFFREQAEVLPLLVGFLSRTKTPDLVVETLSVMYTLLSTPTASESNESDAEAIHPELNAAFILNRSVSADSAWKAGEPFINLFNLATLSPDIRIKAIEVYDLLLRASIAHSEPAAEATTTLLQFQSVGSPCSALLSCLGVDNGELQFAALLCLRSLMKTSPNEEFLEKFEMETGVSRTLEFVVHSERRFHRPALDILERLSHFECGREYLKNNDAAKFLRDAIREAQETIVKTSTIVPVSGMDSSPLSSEDAPLLCANIEIICQVFARLTLAKEQVAANNYVAGDQTLFMDFIDAGVAILLYDINSALNPVPVPTESPRTTGGAAAAAAATANAAAANAAALASLLPFSIDRCMAVISTVGRLVEHSELCKAHAKSKGILPVLLDCFKVKGADKLHQVGDKLLHLCVHVGDAPEFLHRRASQEHDNDAAENESDKQQQEVERKRIDPNILCAVATGVEAENELPDAPSTGERPPLVAVDAVLTLLEASHATANEPLVFRHLRWIAALVDLPGNANALGERAVSLFLQILADTPSSEELRFAFLAKCIRAIVLQNSAALELCGSAHLDPSAPFFSFLRNESEPIEAGQSFSADANSTFLSQPIDEDPSKPEELDASKDESEPVSDSCRLEWIDEYDEQAAFDPNPLTEACHDVDVYLSVADALTALTGAFLRWNSTSNGPTTTDFSELIASKLESEHAASGKAGIATTAGSKKKLATDPVKASAVGEAVMLAVLEKGMQVPKLVSKYAAVNPSVCVTLLELLNNLMTVPGGLKVLLNLAKAELQTHAQAETVTPGEAVNEWPLSAQLSAQSEHARLLSPVLGVLQSPDTSFIEIEAAVRTIAVLTSDLETTDKEPPTSAPDPVVETAKSPTKGAAAAAPPPPAAPTVPELVVRESDRFINAALGCGALVLLLAFMDQARLPVGSGDSPDRVRRMETQIEEMVMKFITLAQMKQEHIITKYREKLEQEQPPTTESPSSTQPSKDPELPYQARWAQLLLDHKFSVPRFGYESYSALLLASELALPKLVSTLLNAGASSKTASPEGVTPLMIAFLVGNEEMVIDLLDASADVNAITKDGHDLTVWNCTLASPVKARVSSMITKAYSSSDASDMGISMSSRIQLDSIEGSLQFLDMCLDAGVDANVSNANGDFLLHALLSKSIVRRKLRGLDLCFRYNSYYEDRRRLQRAVTELVEAHGANVNSCNRLGQTPLHLALLYGFTGIAKILLKRGANPNVQGVYGHLPLHYACLGFCGSLDGSDGEAVEIARLLLEQATKYPCTLGVHSDRRKHKSAAEKQALAIENILESGLQSVVEPQAIVQKLATAQQMLTTPSFVGEFLPWHFACGAHVQLSSVLCLDDDMQKWFEANGQARTGIVSYLVSEWEIDIRKCASEGVTALHLAVKSDVNGNNLPVVDLLLENAGSGLNVNAVHEHILIDTLPVIPSGAHVVFVDEDQDMKQAFVSSRSIDSKYHIILADGQHVDGIARDRLQVISDPHQRTSHNFHHHYKYLLPMESRFAALHYALQSNQDTLALRLLALPNISLDPEGSDLPLLALACAARQTPEVVRRLITQQANMRVHLPLRTSKCELTVVDAGTSRTMAKRKHAAALHYAVIYDDLGMVEALVSSPEGYVQPNVRRSGDGFTPLHLACEMENMNIIKLLLGRDASLTQSSSMSAHGVSPLELLMKFDTVENERIKELINEHYLKPEMLLEGSITALNPAVGDNNEANAGTESQANEVDDSDAPSCALLRAEEHNFDLFERVQGLVGDKSGSLARRLQRELDKSDAVLGLFFDLLKQPVDATEAEAESQQPPTPLMAIFQKLRHPHECYRQYMTRSQWKPPKNSKMSRIVSKTALAPEEAPTEPTSSQQYS